MTTASQTPGEPAEFDALFALALGEHRAGRLVEAAAAYRKILAIRPDSAEACNHLGVILWQQGKLDGAAALYEQAIALKPDYVDAHCGLGTVLLGQGKLDEAAARYEQALALRPGNAEVHNDLGILLAQQGKLDLAEARFEQALSLKPNLPETHYNLGKVLLNQGKLSEAVARYQQALALKPDFTEAYYNLGGTLRNQGKPEQAAAQYQRALALRPDYAEAQMHLATCYLVEGDFARGWPAYEGRLRIPKFLSWRHNLPRWMGEPLTGRRVLLLAEPGLGNTILFLRYARLLKERGARVVLAAHTALGRLLASHPDLDELFIPGSANELPRSDFYLPLLSAPYALGTDASNIPCDVPYLWADPELTGKWRQELAGIDGFKIGIVWQGSPSYRHDRWRSTALAHFAPLAGIPGVRLVSLQKGIGSEQVATVDFPVIDLSGRLDETAGPFMDTAAVIRNLDLVVTVDTAIAHLAGALGGAVWVALQFSPYWPWLLGRDDSPWYPTARLFRQTTFDGWPDVFERIAKAVEARRSGTA